MTEPMIVCDWADCTNEFSFSPPAGWIRFEISMGRGRTDHPKGFICPECWLKRPVNKHEEEIVKAWDQRDA